MDPSQKEYEKILKKFKEEICRDPDADFDWEIEMLAAKFRARAEDREKSVVDALLLNLYGQDIRSLKRDLMKIQMADPERAARIKVFDAKKAASSKGADLLPHLCEALSLHTKEELSDAIMEYLWRGHYYMYP